MINLSRLPAEGLRERGSVALLPLSGDGKEALRDASWEVFVLPSNQDFFLEVKGKAIWEGACSRCLEPLDLPLALSSQFMGSKDAELVARGVHALGTQDLDVVYLPETERDETALAIEQFELQVPMHPLCKEDCQGLCPQCGKNWNKGPCSCDPEFTKEPSALAKALAGLRLNLES